MKKFILSSVFLFVFSTLLTAQQSVPCTENNSAIIANNKFAFDLYSMYKTSDENIFISPYSIFTALMMTYEGAKGQTAIEMKEVLNLPDNTVQLRKDFLQMYNEINGDDKKYKLSTANALWAQKDFAFRKDYFDLVQNYYGGSATNLDFKKNAEDSRLLINQWVEDRTNNKIKDLIPPGAIDDYTRLVLTNAIYFKGEWVKNFNKNDTKEQDFKVTPSYIVPVQMMQSNDEFNYAETNNLQILELPYSGDDLSMLIILPKNDLKSIEKSLTPEYLTNLKENLSEQRVNIFIPKFKFETKYFMQSVLEDMGMPSAFSDENANFTGMEDELENLKISQVIHQAFIELNEEGTEAAAATAVIMATMTSTHGSAPVIPTFRADHPFIFIIQQKKSGNILFIGRVNNPS